MQQDASFPCITYFTAHNMWSMHTANDDVSQKLNKETRGTVDSIMQCIKNVWLENRCRIHFMVCNVKQVNFWLHVRYRCFYSELYKPGNPVGDGSEEI